MRTDASGMPLESLVVDIGGIDVNIPAPPGYKEISAYSPDTVTALARLAGRQERLLAVLLSDSDVALIEHGKSPTLARYLLAEVHSPTESKDITPLDFDRIHRRLDQAIRSELAQRTQPHSSPRAAPKVRPAAGGTQIQAIRPLAPGQTRTETIHIDRDIAYGFISLTRYLFVDAGYGGRSSATVDRSQGDTDFLIASASTMLYIKRRVFNIYVYKKLERGDADLDWIAKTSSDWTNAIIQANTGEPSR